MSHFCVTVPLARNQYINNSPGIFSCIRAGANTGATCIRPERISLKNLANMQKMSSQKYFPVFARVRIQAPHVFTQKLLPQEKFPACIGFVPGGTLAAVRSDNVLASKQMQIAPFLSPPSNPASYFCLRLMAEGSVGTLRVILGPTSRGPQIFALRRATSTAERF